MHGISEFFALVRGFCLAARIQETRDAAARLHAEAAALLAEAQAEVAQAQAELERRQAVLARVEAQRAGEHVVPTLITVQWDLSSDLASSSVLATCTASIRVQGTSVAGHC